MTGRAKGDLEPLDQDVVASDLRSAAQDAGEPGIGRHFSQRALVRVDRGLAGVAALGVRLYQRMISPLLAPACRFEPSCSSYALGCLEKHPTPLALKWIVLRVVRCNPWGGHGWDPVPERASAAAGESEGAHDRRKCGEKGRGVLPCVTADRGAVRAVSVDPAGGGQGPVGSTPSLR